MRKLRPHEAFMSTTLHISCPHCDSINRVQNARLNDKPKCGQCKRPLFDGKPLQLNENNIQATLKNNDIPVLVDCWAPWCGPCRGFAPVFEQAARQLEPNIRLAKLDTEAHPALANQWAIRSIPTLILFRQGREVQRIAGAMPLPQLMQWLQQAGVV